MRIDRLAKNQAENRGAETAGHVYWRCIGHRRHQVAELGGFIDLVPHMCSPAHERG